MFTTRWAMSYLRGPLTRDQIATLMAEQKAAARRRRAGDDARPRRLRRCRPPSGAAPREHGRLPPRRRGVELRPTGRHGRDAGGRRGHRGALGRPRRAVAGDASAAIRRRPPRRRRSSPRVALRYDEAKADLVHDEEYEAVLFPLADARRRHARPSPSTTTTATCAEPAGAVAYRIPDAPIKNKTFWTDGREGPRSPSSCAAAASSARQPRAQAVRPARARTPDAFVARCLQAADILRRRRDREVCATSTRRRSRSSRTSSRAAEDRVDVAGTSRTGRRNEELLSTAPARSSAAILGGRRSRGSAARQGRLRSRAGRSRTAAAASVPTPRRTRSTCCATSSRISRPSSSRS